MSMKHDRIITAGWIPFPNRTRMHHFDHVQDARGIAGALVCGSCGSGSSFTQTMVLYETD